MYQPMPDEERILGEIVKGHLYNTFFVSRLPPLRMNAFIAC